MNKINLEKLTIINFATIEQEDIIFDKEFNSIIGETGSGKSLILDALSLILGQRADKSIIRRGKDESIIEATFSFHGNETKEYFQSIGHPITNNKIIIKRIINSKNSSSCFINFQQSTLKDLSNFTKRFFDLVGQFENQRLLSSNYQLALLDRFSKNEKFLTTHQKKYKEYKDLLNTIGELKSKYTELQSKEDFLKYQLDEITQIAPHENEDEELKIKKENLIKRESQSNAVNQTLSLLSESDNSVENQVSLITGKLSSDLPLALQEQLIQIKEAINDLSYSLSNYTSNSENDESLDEIVDRLDLIQKLKRKHGKTLEDVFNAKKQLTLEINEIDTLDEQLSLLQIKQKSLESSLATSSSILHDARSKNATKLSKLLTKEISELNMPGAQIRINVMKTDTISNTGSSSIEIFAQTNPGEGEFPLRKIASGGELSRILLSIRGIISLTDGISIFLFDEIDTGIGGQTAILIGKKLKELSFTSQVIAITHLPQIAKFSTKAINVKKTTRKNEHNNRTYTTIEHLSEDNLGHLLSEMKGEIGGVQ